MVLYGYYKPTIVMSSAFYHYSVVCTLEDIAVGVGGRMIAQAIVALTCVHYEDMLFVSSGTWLP